MLETLKESQRFSEAQLELLRPKAPIPPAGPKSVPISISFECLGGTAAKTTAGAVWNFHPLFVPTTDDDPLAALPDLSPAAACPDWWDTPAGTMEEASKFVEASQQISDKRNPLWADKDRNPDHIREAAAEMASECTPQPRMGSGDH